MSLKRIVPVISLAVATAASTGEGFQADPLTKAQLSFLCIYTFLYLVLTALCVPILLNAGKHLRIYLILFLSLLFATISTIASIFNLVVLSGAIMPSNLGATMVALGALTNFFGNWSPPLIFLSICLLIHDRSLAIRNTGILRIFPMAYYTMFALMMIFATVASILYVNYLSILYIGDRLAGHTIEWVNQKAEIMNDLMYTFSALCYFSFPLATLYAVLVHREMQRLSIKDKILRTILFAIVPTCFLWVLEGIVFMILTSPAGIRHISTLTQLEAMQFSSFLLANFFNFVVFNIMVVLGSSRNSSHTEMVDGLAPLTRKYSETASL